MKKLLRTAVVGAGMAAACLALAQPAWANSFTKLVVDGGVTYNDRADRFCAAAYDTGGKRSVTVKLTPVNGSGPSYKWTDTNIYYPKGAQSGTCRSLASAYEDSKYRAVVWTYSAKRGTTVKRATITFHS